MSNEYEVSAYPPDNILIARDGNDIWLKAALDEMVSFTEFVLCEANAKEVYDVACILEYMAGDLRKKYDLWKRRDFEGTYRR